MNIIVEPSMQLVRSKLPEIVYEMENYLQGETGDHPDSSDYVLEVQEFIRNCIGFDCLRPTITTEEDENE